jgi:hypothetical protein
MKRELAGLSMTVWLACAFAACGDSGTTGSSGSGGTSGASMTGTSGGSAGSGGSATTGGGGPTGGTGGVIGAGGSAGVAGSSSGGSTGAGGAIGSAGSPGDGGSVGSVTCDQIPALVAAYKAAHPGNGGKDWDINAKTPAEIAADPAAQKLLSICGPDQRPVIPQIAWEYGGADHPWINPAASAVVYCVYVPVKPNTTHWAYVAAMDHVTADVYVKCPDQNPCKDRQGADQVMACLGDPTNIEILVDTVNMNDGVDVGLALANASTDLNLILPDGTTKVHMYTGL